ncbi:MAG: protein translocase subunit SecF [Coriobacteriales bacterium]|jgi:SecD/SecF fusion protein|nr:protein translocase subunit SecF [Coriobacteriales bacterium]
MVRPFKKEINFLVHRKLFFIISAVLVVLSIAALPIRGLNFGIEFVGGTSIDFKGTGEISIEQMRSAFDELSLADLPVIQTTNDARTGESGFIVRITTTDAGEASAYADQVAATLGIDETTAEVMTISPSWGADVARTSLLAFLAAIVLIIAYIALRFEYKMGIVAVISLIHDMLVIVGVYAVFGREVTPNVVAALLTIMGYSLYDTVVVFHRINDNMATTANHSFMTVANHSINQVFMRTINTTLSTLIPVVAMLIFGGETLKDFAFAMAIGLILGSYSSIGLASPLYALWKQREPKYRKLAAKYGEGLDEFTIAEQLRD